jgi:hypothetical protein
MMPNVQGRIEIMRMFYRKFTLSTLLVIGLHTGRFVCWNVSHPVLETSVEEDGTERTVSRALPPILTTVSPVMESKDQCEIVDIKEGTLNSCSLVMLYRNGHVRVWDINPVSVAGRRKKASHLRNMFPTDPESNFVPTIASLMFHINALDLSMPGVNPKQEEEYVFCSIVLSSFLPILIPSYSCL